MGCILLSKRKNTVLCMEKPAMMGGRGRLDKKKLTIWSDW